MLLLEPQMMMPTGLTIKFDRMRRIRDDRQGFSLTEMLVTVAVVGIVAAVAVTNMGSILPGSKVTVARHVVETLNQGVNGYVQLHGSELRAVVSDDSSGDEELAVLRALQWDSPTDPDPGAPYVRPDYDPSVSGNDEDYRIVWNGEFFEVREPGDAGTGLQVRFDAADLGRMVVFADDFVPLKSD